MLSDKLKYLSEYEWMTIWPIISVVLFTSVFIFIIIMVIRFKKKDVADWESMPLEDDSTESSAELSNHLG